MAIQKCMSMTINGRPHTPTPPQQQLLSTQPPPPPIQPQYNYLQLHLHHLHHPPKICTICTPTGRSRHRPTYARRRRLITTKITTLVSPIASLPPSARLRSRERAHRSAPSTLPRGMTNSNSLARDTRPARSQISMLEKHPSARGEPPSHLPPSLSPTCLSRCSLLPL